MEAAQTTILTQTAWGLYASGFGDIERFNAFGNHDWVSVSILGGLGMVKDILWDLDDYIFTDFEKSPSWCRLFTRIGFLSYLEVRF